MKNQHEDVRAAVGFAAGDIFHLLEQRHQADLNTLRTELRHIDEPILFQGMGWLMREGKIQVVPSNNGNFAIRLERN